MSELIVSAGTNVNTQENIELDNLDLNLNLDDIFSNSGPLAKYFSGYTYRKQQLELAKKISKTIKTKKVLLAEAGTGTGKTLAYLIPAILSSNTVVISTGTKNLQNQLFFRDLPNIVKSLKVPIRSALLKGRANYLCKYRLELALTDLLLASKEMVIQLKQIINWADSTNDGDLSTLDDIPEDSEVFGHVTSTPDNCLSQDCPFIKDCFVYKARQKALEAKIIVINHHLLLSDWGIKEEQTDAKLLPDGVNLILDEAHQLPQIASFYFGRVLSSKKIKLLIQDIILEQQEHAKDSNILKQLSNDLEVALENVLKTLLMKPERGFYDSLVSDDNYNNKIKELLYIFQDLADSLEINIDRSKGLGSCYERAQGFIQDLELFMDNKSKTSLDNREKNNNKNIKWYEVYKQNFIFKQSPLEIGELFTEKLAEMARSAILTSATLSVAGDFNLIKSDLGLKDAEVMKISSPFDYNKNSLLYIPRGMPDPLADKYHDKYIEQVVPVLHASKGRAFLLFTSFNSMHIAYERLCELFLEQDCYNILMQGTASKTALIERFKAQENAILLATASFWEGIDVKGSDLHCVVIDKLPFTSPSEPLLQAKIKHLREQGRNPFIELQCQEAALQLTQGAGRLIRSEQDYGVLMICDPRIISKNYGHLFLDSLPDMPRTREITKIKEFYQNTMI